MVCFALRQNTNGRSFPSERKHPTASNKHDEVFMCFERSSHVFNRVMRTCNCSRTAQTSTCPDELDPHRARCSSGKSLRFVRRAHRSCFSSYVTFPINRSVGTVPALAFLPKPRQLA